MTRRNALLGIFRLPTELLMDIAYHFLENAYHILRDRKNLTLTSRRWRDILENSPKLWTHLAPNYPAAYTTTALVRSKSYPLTIRPFPENYPHFHTIKIDFPQTVLAEVHRWHSAEISLDPLPPDPTIAQLEMPAPHIMKVILKNSKTGGMTVSRPVDLFRGHAPHLRHLELANIPIPWNSAILAGLTTLVMEIQTGADPTPVELLHIFQNCPNLVKVHLRGSSRRPSAADVPEIEAYLSRLEDLALMEFDAGILGPVLASIYAPNCSQLKLDCTSTPDRPPSIVLPGHHALAESFPGIHDNVCDVREVIVKDPSPDEVTMSFKEYDEENGFEVTLRGCTLAQALEWFGEVVPDLKEKSATLEYAMALAGYVDVLKLLDQHLWVTGLSNSCEDLDPDEDDTVELLDFLGTPELGAEAVFRWPMECLEELKLKGEEACGQALLEMLDSRYGSGRWRPLATKYPRKLETLHLSVPSRPSEKFQVELGSIVGCNLAKYSWDRRWDEVEY